MYGNIVIYYNMKNREKSENILAGSSVLPM